MIDSSTFAGAELFNHDSVLKKMEIKAYDENDNIIADVTNEDIHYESFELTESICSEKDLRFGGCEASSVKFKCSNVNASLKGKKITVDVSVTDNTIADSRISGIYDANLANQMIDKVYYTMSMWNYIISSGSGTYNINMRFDKVPQTMTNADVYMYLNGANVPITDRYWSLDEGAKVKEGNIDIYSIYTITIVYVAEPVTAISFTLTGKVSDQKLRIGTYYVDTVKKLNERRFLEVTAYDVMYKILNADVTSWYDTAMQSLPMTVADLRDSLFTYITGTLGLLVTQETATLANDGITIIRKYIDTTDGKTVVKGSDIIIPICEINGVFGHVGRDNVFHYIALEAGELSLFPANDLYPNDDLFPDSIFANVDCDDVKYITSYYEDFYTVPIDGVTIIDTHNDRVGRFYHTNPQNIYRIEDNLMVLSTNDHPSDIAQNLLLAIYKISYIPHETKALGNPCYEVGDAIRYRTRFKQVESYILQRRLTGIQAMKDTIIADGEEYYQ